MRPRPAASPVGITQGMKTAVSIPNALFASAEALAARLRTTRSALYAAALREFVARHEPEALAAWVARYNTSLADPDARAHARLPTEQLRKVEW